MKRREKIKENSQEKEAIGGAREEGGVKCSEGDLWKGSDARSKRKKKTTGVTDRLRPGKDSAVNVSRGTSWGQEAIRK